MSSVQGPDSNIPPLSRHDRILYEKEYQQAADLFGRALTEYERADEIHKKEAFRGVMERAMQILNETARELKRTDLVQQNQQIASSFQVLQESETDTAGLAQNLKQAKKSV